MREIGAHYQAVRSATSKPIMIYNNPPVVGVRLALDTLVRLTNDGVIQYIKDADSDPYTITRLRMHLGDKLGLFYGHDNNALGAFAFGATGWVSGSGNFDPKRWAKIVHLCIDDGNFVGARKPWDHISPFVDPVTVRRHGERMRDLLGIGAFVATVRTCIASLDAGIREVAVGTLDVAELAQRHRALVDAYGSRRIFPNRRGM